MIDVDMYNEVLGLGKVRQEVLRRSVFSMLPLEAEPTLDGGTISMGGRAVIAHSPSIGVPLDALGFFAFHYAASNVAARFARPKHLVTGIYLPLKTKEKELRTITSVLGEEARKFGVTVVAGQTATYYGLEIPLVTTTCFGEPVRQPENPQPGDIVMIVGAVGGEAVWLKALSQEARDEVWREFTPLRAALRLQDVEGTKLMHDVSEGGVKKALGEVAEATGVRVEVDTDEMFYVEGVKELGQDILRAPTYGALIVLAEPGAEDETRRVCGELEIPIASAGFIKEGAGVYVDGEKVEAFARIALDEIYGSFEREGSKQG